MRWQVSMLPIAEKLLAEIGDRRIRENIAKRIDGLANDPEKQGKAMIGELRGYRSGRAVGHSYRILYRVEAEHVIVVVVALGIRKEGDKQDVYELAKKLVRLGLLS